MSKEEYSKFKIKTPDYESVVHYIYKTTKVSKAVMKIKNNKLALLGRKIEKNDKSSDVIPKIKIKKKIVHKFNSLDQS